MPDPIAAWRAARGGEDAPVDSVADLQGTVFDDTDPIARWRRETAPKPDSLGFVGRGIRSALDFMARPIRPVADYLERNADTLTNTIPPNENSLSTASPLSLLKAYGAGVNKTLAGMASPAGAASFAGGPVGVGARAFLAGQQIPAGVEETAAGVRARSPQQIASGVGTTALGAALVAGDIGRGVGEVAREARVPTLSGELVDEPAAARLELPPASTRRALGPAPLGLPPSPIDADFEAALNDYRDRATGRAEPPLGLAGGAPSRFTAGAAGVVDAAKDYPTDPIAAWREATGRPAALLPERAGPIAAGLPPEPPMALDEFLGRAGMREGAPLAAIEPNLYPPAAAAPDRAQLGLNELARTMGVSDVQSAPPGVPVDGGTEAATRGGARGAADMPIIRGRELSPEQTQGVDQLDEFLNAIYGENRVSQGNGTYREAGVSPTGAAAAPAGENAGGRPGELASLDESGMDQAGRAQRGARGRRVAKPSADEQFLNDLVDQATADGYQGDPADLRAHISERLQLMKEIEDEFDAGGRNPDVLLRAVAKAGGIGDDTALNGETDWLKGEQDNYGTFANPRYGFGTVRGVKGVFAPKGQGLPYDSMLEALQQDPRFQHLTSINDLIDELREAARNDYDPSVRAKLERAGVSYGEPWWKDVGGAGDETSFDPSTFEDRLDTGERQSRLPEVGKVRDVENSTPSFEAPFSLAAEADTAPRELEQALGFGDRANAPEPVLRPNVRDYLVKQLGYTPDEVSSLDPREAERIGLERVAHPEREARRAPAPAAPVTALAERGDLPSDAAMESFDQVRGARGQQRTAALQRTAVHPEEPGLVEGAPPPKTPQQRAASGETLTAKERQALGLPEESRPRQVTSLREQGVSPRQIAQRVRRLDTWMDDPTPENFARWAEEVTGQAERVNDRQLKGGVGEAQAPPRSPSGEVLYANPMLDPELLKRAWRFLRSNESADRLLRGAIGAGVGAWSDDDHRLQGMVAGALAGIYGPEIASTWGRDFVRLAKGENPFADWKGRLPEIYQKRKGDIGFFESNFGSPLNTVTEQARAVRPAVEAFENVKQSGRVSSRTPLFGERFGESGPAYDGAGKLRVRQGEFLKPEVDYLRREAQAAGARGNKRVASYLNAFADQLGAVETRSEKWLREHGLGKVAKRFSSEAANQIYRAGLAFNPGSAVVNRASQPLLTAPYGGFRNLWKAYGPLSDSEKALSEIKRPIDLEETEKAAIGALRRYDDFAGFMMRYTDNQNRQGAYAMAHRAAEQMGAAPRQAFEFARDVSEKTQGLVGMMSRNPRWRGPVINMVKPFTKFPILVAEWLDHVATTADPRVRWRSAALFAGAWAFSRATGVDLFDMLANGPRYGGSAIVNGAMDAWAHLTNQAKDHTIIAAPGSGFGDSDVGKQTVPVGIAKTIDTAKRFAHQGLEPHKVRTPAGALETVTPLEDLMNLFGVKTTRQTDRQKMLDDAHAAETRAAEEDAQSNAQAKRDLLRALDAEDPEAAQEALAKMSPATARTVLKTQNRDRFDRLLHATPLKRRPELRNRFGTQEQDNRGPQP